MNGQTSGRVPIVPKRKPSGTAGSNGFVWRSQERLADLRLKQAYTGIEYDTDVMLVFSEIDPAVHDAVLANDFGPGKTMTSTINYEPRYF
jgi:hypothetical protein